MFKFFLLLAVLAVALAGNAKVCLFIRVKICVREGLASLNCKWSCNRLIKRALVFAFPLFVLHMSLIVLLQPTKLTSVRPCRRKTPFPADYHRLRKGHCRKRC